MTVALIYLAARLHRPASAGRSRGQRKDSIAYALAPVAGTEVEGLQCYQKVKEEKAIGKFDEPLQRLYVGFKTRCGAPDWSVLQAEL